ncbi:hypothetical protein [Ottowia caeni]|uniref:hypothetical protein n=1 Tax=Ottowia caeni TaxID=2870339 RepID=UPI003D703B58
MIRVIEAFDYAGLTMIEFDQRRSGRTGLDLVERERTYAEDEEQGKIAINQRRMVEVLYGPKSLSDLEIAGCKWAAAVHFSQSS